MILAINSSTFQYSIALLSEEGITIAEYLILPDPNGFTGFMPAMDLLLKSSGTEPEGIKCVAVVTGPGSFTGLRVGLSAAKGMAYSLNIPVIGISGIEALAAGLSHTEMDILSMVTSRRDEVFYGLFQRNREKLDRKSEDRSIRLKDISDLIKEPTIIIGNDYMKQESVIGESGNHNITYAPKEQWILRGSSVGALGLKRFHNGDFDDIRDMVPRYLRPPDIRSSR
ncbi:tRNA (adenosine(37)-N6)-threonylcarbamoyltransferase complex dimerization subunit type 1 TsaB [Thermodesulfobacteriota bacterium]